MNQIYPRPGLVRLPSARPPRTPPYLATPGARVDDSKNVRSVPTHIEHSGDLNAHLRYQRSYSTNSR